ncbi:MAG: hypothetical protein V1862_10870, partial [Methanobacteriota archaeon]
MVRLFIVLISFLCLFMVVATGVAESHEGGFAPHSRTFNTLTVPYGQVNGTESPCCGSGPLRQSPLDLSY